MRTFSRGDITLLQQYTAARTCQQGGVNDPEYKHTAWDCVAGALTHTDNTHTYRRRGVCVHQLGILGGGQVQDGLDLRAGGGENRNTSISYSEVNTIQVHHGNTMLTRLDTMTHVIV